MSEYETKVEPLGRKEYNLPHAPANIYHNVIRHHFRKEHDV